MRKHIILFFLALLFFMACNWGNTPKGILRQEEMINLLTAVHLVDGSLYNIDPSPDSLYKYGTGRYKALFKRFHTDTGQFNKSLKYYTVHPEQLETMYTQVMKNLQSKQDSLTKIIAKQNSKNALPKK